MHPATYILVAVVLFGLYRRVARTIGPQPLRTRSLYWRIALYAALSLLVLDAGATAPLDWLAAAVGLAAGALVAVYALRATKFEARGPAIFYTVHPYFGIAMLVLFVARVVERFVASPKLMAELVSSQAQGASPHAVNLMGAYGSDPWSVGLFLAFTGYWIYYYVGVARAAQQVPEVGS